MKPRSQAVLTLLILAIGSPLILPAQTTTSGIREYRRKHEAEIISELVELLALPNVASDTPNIRRNAAKLIEMMASRGVEARLLEGNGPPAVFGELKTPGATTTVGLYAHYDGQPVDASKWTSEPFKPTLRDKPLEAGGREISFPTSGGIFDPEWRLYARSASDDKAPIIAMLAALDAIKASNRKPTVNLKFLFDGEEEAGSPHLEDIVNRNASFLGADVWLCADGPIHQTRKQLLYFGVRGVVSVNVTVYGADRALHSGHYGNWAPNPAMRLAKLLSSMKDDTGRVLIAGFYDDVEPLGAEEKKALLEMPVTDRELMGEYALTSTEGAQRSLAELINEPSLNIDGLRSEYVGAEARTIIPSEATAAIDLRLVKGIDPTKQIERVIAHIKKQGYFVTSEAPDREMRLKHGMICRVTTSAGYRAVRTSMSLPMSQKIIRAATQGAGSRPILAPTLGGSVPLYILEAATRAPQIGVPIVNHDNNQHSSNENLRLQNLWDGIEIFAALMTM
ncbi:MAG TPA: M20/M25/M40 family metallo-hydrolase [Blastocatellia bacterium]|nr:M20/M25/M40 family metallo-hydrolase [Blastocatellia bacterium]